MSNITKLKHRTTTSLWLQFLVYVALFAASCVEIRAAEAPGNWLCSAMEHDRVGQHEKATEYLRAYFKERKACASPDAIRQILYFRKTAGDQDYFAELVSTKTYGLRKSTSLKIYVSDFSLYGSSQQKKIERCIQDALSIWRKCLNATFQFDYVKSQQQADIEILPVANTADLPGATAGAHTRNEPDASKRFIRKSYIRIAGRDAAEGFLRYNLVHEIGHALGLNHSSNAADVMFAIADADFISKHPEPQPSRRDIATFRRLLLKGAADDAQRVLIKEAEACNEYAQFRLGYQYWWEPSTTKNLQLATKWLTLAAKTGSSEAMLSLGDIHSERAEHKEAAQLYQKAASLGNTAAMVALGISYERGLGVKTDQKKANALFQSASKLQNARANARLGLSYEFGKEVPKDVKTAVSLYQRAAEMGDSDGQFFLANMYFNGSGVPCDLRKAYYWYQQSGDNGHLAGRRSAGYLLIELGDSKRAADVLHDYVSQAIKCKDDTDEIKYAALLAAIAFARSGRAGAGEHVIDEVLRTYKINTWSTELLKFQRGKIAEKELLKNAGSDNGKLTDARYLVGMNALLRGDASAAKKEFTWVANHGEKSYWQYRFARSELARSN